MLKVGVAQIPNSVSLEENYTAISNFLTRFEQTAVDLVLFPECSLSGFSAKITECSMDRLTPFLDSIAQWSKKTRTHVVLPTAISEYGKVFNSGFWFTGREIKRFQKLGLTESEKKFFSVSADNTEKVFEVNGYKCALLICMEAQQAHNTHFEAGAAHFILWPGYWGWTNQDKWSGESREGKPNLIFENMSSWRIPLIQSNFAYNDLQDERRSGPEGLSVVVDENNVLRYQGGHKKEMGFVVTLEQRTLKFVAPLLP